MKALHKRHTLVGVGGLNCPCCAPQSGNKYAAKARTILKRQAKRRFDRQVNREQAVRTYLFPQGADDG